jgi:hypothetical protein
MVFDCGVGLLLCEHYLPAPGFPNLVECAVRSSLRADRQRHWRA